MDLNREIEKIDNPEIYGGCRKMDGIANTTDSIEKGGRDEEVSADKFAFHTNEDKTLLYVKTSFGLEHMIPVSSITCIKRNPGSKKLVIATSGTEGAFIFRHQNEEDQESAYRFLEDLLESFYA